METTLHLSVCWRQARARASECPPFIGDVFCFVISLSQLYLRNKSKDGGGSDAGSGTVSPHSASFSEDGHSRSGRSSGTTTPGYTDDDASADGAMVAEEEAPKDVESKPAHSGAPVEISTTADANAASDVHHTHLVETATITIFSLKAQRISDESPDFEMFKQHNATYEQALKDRIGNDSFVPRGTQTLNPLMKTKDTNTVYTHTRDTACDSAGMDIADMVSRAANSTQTDFVDLRSKGKKSRSVASGKDLPVKEVLESALLLERLITQNMFHERHMLYRFYNQSCHFFDFVVDLFLSETRKNLKLATRYHRSGLIPFGLINAI